MQDTMLAHLDIKESWSKTMDLRFVYRNVNSKILQQLQISNLGNKKWIDIKSESE